MFIKLSTLRKFIHEEIARNVEWTAGFYGGAGVGKGNAGVVQPPPGLGSEEEEIRDEEEEEFTQLGVRARRQDRTFRGR